MASPSVSQKSDKRKIGIGIVVVLILVGSSIGLWYLFAPPTETPPTNTTTTTIGNQYATATVTQTIDPVISRTAQPHSSAIFGTIYNQTFEDGDPNLDNVVMSKLDGGDPRNYVYLDDQYAFQGEQSARMEMNYLNGSGGAVCNLQNNESRGQYYLAGIDVGLTADLTYAYQFDGNNTNAEVIGIIALATMATGMIPIVVNHRSSWNKSTTLTFTRELLGLGGLFGEMIEGNGLLYLSVNDTTHDGAWNVVNIPNLRSLGMQANADNYTVRNHYQDDPVAFIGMMFVVLQNQSVSETYSSFDFWLDDLRVTAKPFSYDAVWFLEPDDTVIYGYTITTSISLTLLNLTMNFDENRLASHVMVYVLNYVNITDVNASIVRVPEDMIYFLTIDFYNMTINNTDGVLIGDSPASQFNTTVTSGIIPLQYDDTIGTYLSYNFTAMYRVYATLNNGNYADAKTTTPRDLNGDFAVYTVTPMVIEGSTVSPMPFIGAGVAGILLAGFGIVSRKRRNAPRCTAPCKWNGKSCVCPPKRK